MVYEVVYTKSAVKDIKKLDRVAQKKLAKKLLILCKNPFHNSKKLINFRLGTYRHRVGDYRIIFDIEKNRIVVLRVGHIKEIYFSKK